MALRTLAGKWRAGAVAATAIAAGGTVAYCEDPKGVGFDPEALERGAKALREINKSPYAKKVRSHCLPHCHMVDGQSRQCCQNTLAIVLL